MNKLPSFGLICSLVLFFFQNYESKLSTWSRSKAKCISPPPTVQSTPSTKQKKRKAVLKLDHVMQKSPEAMGVRYIIKWSALTIKKRMLSMLQWSRKTIKIKMCAYK